MPAQYTPQSYIEKKDDILTRCLKLTEDVYSGVKDSEKLAGLLDRRMETIRELQELEKAAREAREACPKEALDRLDSKLRLILSLDEKTESAMTNARRELLGAMKSNTMEQKFMGYAAAASPERGRLLNEKQ
jgi:ferredoxin